MFRALLVVLGVVASSITSARADANSMKARKKKPLSIGYHVTQDPFSAIGYSVSRMLGGRFEMSLLFLKGSEDLRNSFASEFEIVDETYSYAAEGEGIIARLGSRFFVDNSFSLLLGTSYRKAEVSLVLANPSQQWSVSPSYKQENFLIYYGLGNQWSFDSGFVFGLDWIIAPKSIAEQTTYSNTSNGLTPDLEVILEEPLKEWMMKSAEENLIRNVLVTMGWRF